MIPISEIFISVSGEGINSGVPALFVRVAGCQYSEANHPCTYCDSSFAWHVDSGKWYTADELKEDIDKLMATNRLSELILTGGEPLWHPDSREIIRYCSQKYRLTVETNGGLPIWDEKCCWSLDIKCPSSGNSEYNEYGNIPLLKAKDQIKFVIGDRADYDFARQVVKSRLCMTNIIFQPVWKVLPLATLATWLIEDKELNSLSKVRLGTQLQKHAWPRRKRGI